MFKKIFLVLLEILIFTCDAPADKIFLKSGQIEKGKIRKTEKGMTYQDWCLGEDKVILENDSGPYQCLSENDIDKIEKTFKKPKGVALLAKDEKWGEKQNGFQTQLIPANRQYVVGQPMILHLVLKNVGGDFQRYDKQDMSSLSIKDTNGNQVFSKSPPVQKLGSSFPIDTGEIFSLFEKEDITSEYVIVKPGKYTIQFIGFQDGPTTDFYLPSSNIIEFEVKPGIPNPHDVIIYSLKDILPNNHWDMYMIQGWMDNQYPRGRKPVKSIGVAMGTYNLTKSGVRTGYKPAYVSIDLWQTDEMAEEVEHEEAAGKVSEYWGKDSNGKYVYVYMSENAEEFWPTVRNDVTVALKLIK